MLCLPSGAIARPCDRPRSGRIYGRCDRRSLPPGVDRAPGESSSMLTRSLHEIHAFSDTWFRDHPGGSDQEAVPSSQADGRKHRLSIVPDGERVSLPPGRLHLVKLDARAPSSAQARPSFICSSPRRRYRHRASSERPTGNVRMRKRSTEHGPSTPTAGYLHGEYWNRRASSRPADHRPAVVRPHSPIVWVPLSPSYSRECCDTFQTSSIIPSLQHPSPP